MGTQAGFHSQGTRKSLVSYLKLKEKIYLNTPAGLRACKNEFSNGFPGFGFLGTEQNPDIPKSETNKKESFALLTLSFEYQLLLKTRCVVVRSLMIRRAESNY